MSHKNNEKNKNGDAKEISKVKKKSTNDHPSLFLIDSDVDEINEIEELKVIDSKESDDSSSEESNNKKSCDNPD